MKQQGQHSRENISRVQSSEYCEIVFIWSKRNSHVGRLIHIHESKKKHKKLKTEKSQMRRIS